MTSKDYLIDKILKHWDINENHLKQKSKMQERYNFLLEIIEHQEEDCVKKIIDVVTNYLMSSLSSDLKDRSKNKKYDNQYDQYNIKSFK